MEMNDVCTTLEQEGFDRESLLESLSLDFMTDNIRLQLNGSFHSTLDYLSIVISKFKTILDYDGIDEEDKSEIKHQIIDFSDALIYDIAQQYNLGVNMIFDDYESHLNLLGALYNFFIINKFSNVEDFIVSYITINKVPLIESLDISDSEKDITTLANKKKNISDVNIAILSHVDSVVNFVRRGNLVDAEEYLDVLSQRSGLSCVNDMIDYFQTGTLSGDFTGILLNEILGDDYDNGSVTRIRSTIRTEFNN